MKKLYINGRFLTQKITGMQRVALELVISLDQYLFSNSSKNSHLEVAVILPARFKLPEGVNLKSIRIITSNYLTGHLWEQIELPWITRDGHLIHFSGAACFLKKRQSILIADASVFTHSYSFSFFYRLFYQLNATFAFLQCTNIWTVSKTSKKILSTLFPNNCEKLSILDIGDFNYLDSLKADESILYKLNLIPRDFYLTVSSIHPYKNVRFLVDYFKQRNSKKLVVVGSPNSSVFKNNLGSPDTHKNIIFTGRISDPELKCLYTKSNALISPSLSEGFNLTGREALSCGTNIVLSDIPTHKEIYDGIAFFFNPQNFSSLDLALNQLEKKSLSSKGWSIKNTEKNCKTILTSILDR